jgi:nanoRNase/pAp phosphatase (c-di-AMP/oligoRNAs hydrolase)
MPDLGNVIDSGQIGSVKLTEQLAASSTRPEIKIDHHGRDWRCNLASIYGMPDFGKVEE